MGGGRNSKRGAIFLGDSPQGANIAPLLRGGKSPGGRISCDTGHYLWKGEGKNKGGGGLMYK